MAEEITKWQDPNTGEVVEWDGQKYVTIIPPYKNLPRQALSQEIKEKTESFVTGAPSAVASGIRNVIEGINTPFEFVGNIAGEGLGETVRSATEKLLGPTGSAVAGTTVGAPINTAIQFFGPGYALKGAVGAAKIGTRLLPGSQAARIEIGINKLKEATAKLVPVRTSEEIYKDVRGSTNISIPTPNLTKQLDEIIAVEKSLSDAAKDQTMLNAAESLKSKIQTNGGAIDLREFGRELSGMGENVEALRSQGKRVHGGFAQMFKAAAQDLEKYPSGKLLREAAETYRKEQALDELDDIIDNAILLKRGTGAKDINANRVTKQIDKKPFLQESFAAGELDEVKNLLQKLVEMPAPSPPRGAAFGAGRFTATGGAIAGPALILGIDPAFASGLGVSFASLMEVSRRLLPSPIGRKALRTILESGPIDANKLNRLNALARGITGINLPTIFGDNPESKQFKREFINVMKDQQLSIDEKIRLAIEAKKAKNFATMNQ